MIDTLTSELADLEASLHEEIPCLGVSWIGDCPDGAAAVWRLHGPHMHGQGQSLKCQKCYDTWRSKVEDCVLFLGYVICRTCGKRFESVEDFANYRRL